MRLIDAVLYWCWVWTWRKLLRLSAWLALVSAYVSPFEGDHKSKPLPPLLLRGALALGLIKLCAAVTTIAEAMQRAGRQ